MKTLITLPKHSFRETFVTKEVIQRLASFSDIVWNEKEEDLTEAELKVKLNDVDFCLTGWGTKRFTEEVLKGNEKLKFIAHTGGSVAGIVSEALYDRGIQVSSGNKMYAISVAEGCLAYFMFALRRIPYYMSELKKGEWHDDDRYTEGLFDQTIGIVSLGEISRNLIELLRPFQCKIKVYSRKQDQNLAAKLGFTYASLEEIFSTSKIVSVHTALNPQTVNMIGEDLINLMPRGSILVNTARGAIVSESALLKRLQTGEISAVLDVFTEEPLPLSSPFIPLENALLLPHLGGPTIDRRKFISLYLVDEIKRFIDNRPLEFEIPRDVGLNMSQV